MTECSLGGAGCASLASRQFRALGTTAFVATTRPQSIATAELLLREELEEFDRACSRFRPDSEITRVHSERGRTVAVSPLLGESVRLALEAAERTHGAVDPTVGAAVIGLGYDRDFAQLSEKDSSTAFRAQPAQGWRCIELDASNRLLRVPADVVLDLGATAKAYAADRAASRIAEVTGGGVLVNLGGDISVHGAPPEGWAIGLALDCATSPSDVTVVVSIRQGGLASSGTTVRSWRHGARRVHHIIDPRTGDSAETCWELASVAAPSCAEANVVSTAAIVWGDAAIDRLSAIGLPSRLVGDDGRVATLNGWPPDPGDVRGRREKVN